MSKALAYGIGALVAAEATGVTNLSGSLEGDVDDGPGIEMPSINLPEQPGLSPETLLALTQQRNDGPGIGEIAALLEASRDPVGAARDRVPTQEEIERYIDEQIPDRDDLTGGDGSNDGNNRNRDRNDDGSGNGGLGYMAGQFLGGSFLDLYRGGIDSGTEFREDHIEDAELHPEVDYFLKTLDPRTGPGGEPWSESWDAGTRAAEDGPLPTNQDWINWGRSAYEKVDGLGAGGGDVETQNSAASASTSTEIDPSNIQWDNPIGGTKPTSTRDAEKPRVSVSVPSADEDDPFDSIRRAAGLGGIR